MQINNYGSAVSDCRAGLILNQIVKTYHYTEYKL